MSRCVARIGPLALFGSLLLAAPSFAQDQASLLLRDSTTVAGTFEDLANGLVYLRVSLHDQRRIPLGDIVFIDLVNPSPRTTRDEIRLAQGPHHLFLFRDNRYEMGQLVTIEGGPGSSREDIPRAVVFRGANGQDRRVAWGELARIHLLDMAMPATPAPAPPRPATAEAVSGAIMVRADSGWVNTHLTIRRGDRVAFRTTGEVQLARGGELAGAAGVPSGRTSAGALMPGVPLGALIGRVGAGPPFAIGDQTGALPVPGEGLLFLAVNDDSPGDNSGLFQVVVMPSR
ncbi:MAG: hypothetical protein AB1635_18635 [Acidobacteriota bacterium]